MDAEIRRANSFIEFDTPEGCAILEVSNDESDSSVSISRARVPRGISTEWHRLRDTDERYIIISGCGRVEVGDLPPAVVGPGDVVRIPANMPQRITNMADEDLVFFCVCTPPFTQAAYLPGRK
jgi:mannose-6-phosphate isomerase-like protein (cupin superfamily)